MTENEKKKREYSAGLFCAIILVLCVAAYFYFLVLNQKTAKSEKKSDPEKNYYYAKDTIEGKIERMAGLSRSKLIFNVPWKGKIAPIQISKRAGDQYIYIRFTTINLFDKIIDTGKKERDRVMWTMDLMKLKWLKTVYVDPYIYGKMDGEYQYLCPISWKYSKSSDGKFYAVSKRNSYYYDGEFHRKR